MALLTPLKQSTATTLLIGPFLDDTDGKTAETALTISQADVLLWKEGGTTLAQKNESTSATHRSHGLYTVPIDATDTNTLGVLTVSVQESGALPVRQDYEVVTADEFDRKFAIVGAVPALGIIDRGTAQSATSTTLVLRSAATFADDTPIGATLMAFGATQGYWQSRSVTDYVLSTDTATVDAWTVTPSGTITYVLLAGAPAGSAITAIANAVVEAEIDALETYNRTSNTAATITGPTSGAVTLAIVTDASYEPIKSIA
jgi:hypothetical protein